MVAHLKIEIYFLYVCMSDCEDHIVVASGNHNRNQWLLLLVLWSQLDHIQIAVVMQLVPVCSDKYSINTTERK